MSFCTKKIPEVPESVGACFEAIPLISEELEAFLRSVEGLFEPSLPLVSPLEGRIEKEPNKLETCSIATSEIERLRDYRKKRQVQISWLNFIN